MQKVHFIGIGGIGMSALASIIMHQGTKISGSDINKNDLTESLKEDGAEIYYEHSPKNIPAACEMVVYSEAINEDNPERIEAIHRGIKTISYAKALGEIANEKILILITGTHGKTTVTGMLSKIAVDAGLDPTVVIGSRMKEFNGKNYRIGKSDLFIAEGCEYRRSFLNFKPNILIITNAEPDHLDYFKDENDYYEAFKELITKMPNDGIIIANHDDYGTQKILQDAKQTLNTYGLNDLFKFYDETRLELRVPGNHNRLNAICAFKAAKALEINEELIIESLMAFQGTWRRLELVKEIDGTKIYDDYAHHPTEILATLQALREIYPNKKICAVFQPHQFNRTRHFLKDFANSFEEANTIIIPNIYGVRDSKEDMEKVSSKDLVDLISKNHKEVIDGKGLEKTAQYIQENINKWDIVILMGAGDVTSIQTMLS